MKRFGSCMPRLDASEACAVDSPFMTEALAMEEKKRVTMSSLVAAVVLVVMKIVVGLWSGSLGILAEAAHSATDLLAVLMTFFAIRMAGKPADGDHPYGHGKFETLSAFFEILLLLGVCVWIVLEAVERLMGAPMEVDPSFWAFGVMFISIGVDVLRSRALNAAAQKYNSPALEADALHFASDIWSSLAVLMGLGGVLIARTFPDLAFLEKADAVAALIVAAVIANVSFRLGKDTIDGLLDAAPSGMTVQVCKIVEAVPGVRSVHEVRVRRSGAHYFADMHIVMAPETPLSQTYAAIKEIEARILEVYPSTDVTVRPQPEKNS